VLSLSGGEHWIARWEREAEELRVGRFAPEFWQEGSRSSAGEGDGDVQAKGPRDAGEARAPFPRA
jgi:hypothetical protein